MPVPDQSNRANELAESESRYRRLADSGIIGVYEGDGMGRIVDCNGAFLQMFGYSRDDLEAGLIRWDQLTVPGYEAVNRRLIEQIAASGTTAPAELEYFRKDGSRMPAAVGMASLPAAPEEIRAIGFILDLTPQKQAQEALRKSEEQFRQLAENIREVFWIRDRGTVLYVSPAYEQIWGHSCASLYANPASWMDSIHPEDKRGAEETSHRQAAGEDLNNEYRIIQPSGAIRWIRTRSFPIADAAGHIVRTAGVAEDMTERKLAELRLAHQALYDELTDLPNRTLFHENLERAVAGCGAGKSGAVFFIDLDQFKLVNDTLGHPAGDELLKEAAQRLLSVCDRQSDTLARFGGDEFMLVATGFRGTEEVRRLGARLLACLEAPFRISGREVFIGASIGISLFPEDGTEPYALKRDADVAMHEAKRAGKNQIRFFTPAFADSARERLQMETRLRRALALSEFRLQFQPQFASGCSRPSRFEALIRWYPSGEQPVPPLKFIPLAEQNGLIVPIGTWVLQEACQHCAEWQKGPLRGTGVAVNVSALQFACADFVRIVAKTLDATGLAPQLLELELTESVFIKDLSASARTLTRLRKLGVTIALDDFGTGYSSLSYLQNLPINALKIDRSFLLEAKNRKQGTAVMRCVVDLAHSLGLRVVGEGVETTAQLDFLGGLGCDEIQGYLLGRPSFDVSGEADGATREPPYPGFADSLSRIAAQVNRGAFPSLPAPHPPAISAPVTD